MTDQQMQGLQHFIKLGCAGCHAGPFNYSAPDGTEEFSFPPD